MYVRCTKLTDIAKALGKVLPPKKLFGAETLRNKIAGSLLRNLSVKTMNMLQQVKLIHLEN